MTRARRRTEKPASAEEAPTPVQLHDLGIGLLFKHIRDAVVVADVETDRIVLWNQVAEQLFGYSAEEAIGQPVTLIMPDRFKPMHLEGMRIYRETGHGRLIDSKRPIEVPGRHRSGDEFDIELSLSPIPTRLGKHRFVLAIIRDVTQRKQAALALAQQKDLLERIISHAPAAFAFLDQDLVYRWDNLPHARMLGIPQDRIIGRRIDEVLEDAAAGVIPQLREVLESGDTYHAQGVPLPVPHEGMKAQTHWDLSFVPVPDLNGKPVGILSMATEVSERVELERLQRLQIEQLQHLDTLKDQFLSVLSHELRTPIQAVTGFGSLLEDEIAGALNTEQHDFVRKILGASDALLALINDLLDMSSIRAGKFETAPLSLNLGPLIEATVSSFRPLAAEKGIALNCDIPRDLPTLRADERRIAQVVSNLLENALKFTPQGGSILVRARPGRKHLFCCVADTGIGIPKDQQRMVFQPFTQVDMSSTRPAGGIGLGLSISKAIVASHRGRIGVRSALGKGSVFWFALPLDA